MINCYPAFLVSWLKNMFSTSKLKIETLDCDQAILFENTKAKLIWSVTGAAIVNVFINDKKYGVYLPAESPVIPVSCNMKISVKASSLFKNRKAKFFPDVKLLRYHSANNLQLNVGFLKAPATVSNLGLPMIAYNVRTPRPLIVLKSIKLNSLLTATAETELVERMSLYEQQIDNETLKQYYGNFLL